MKSRTVVFQEKLRKKGMTKKISSVRIDIYNLALHVEMKKKGEWISGQGGKDMPDSEQTRITKDNLWDTISSHQGETFYTAKQLPFTYNVKGGEFFTERKKKSITRATFEQAYQKIQEDSEHKIVGPKTLNCFGAPYVWAVFKELGIVP